MATDDIISNEQRFFQSLQTYLGRYFEVVTGRNAYTINKEKHAALMKNDGVYFLLEKPPEEGLKQTYDKALMLPANVAHAHFTTNDPARIKSSYHLPADKIRFKFHAQIHRIYEFPTSAFIIKIFPMATSRRSFSFQKKEVDHLRKYNGYFLFLCMSPEGRLIDTVCISAERISIPAGHSSKEMPIDLSATGVERLKFFQIPSQTTLAAPQTEKEKLIAQAMAEKDHWPVHESHCCPECGCKYGDVTCPVVLGLTTKHNTHCESCEMDAKRLAVTDPQDIINAYFNRGTEIIITLPEGKSSLVLTCMITKTERR